MPVPRRHRACAVAATAGGAAARRRPLLTLLSLLLATRASAAPPRPHPPAFAAGLDWAALQETLDCWAAPGAWVPAPPGRDTLDDWEWAPARRCAAPLPRWNASAFCASVAGTELLLVGDSMTRQLAQALQPGRRGARAADVPAPRGAPPGARAGYDVAICGGAAKLRVRRNDRLSLARASRASRAFVEVAWARAAATAGVVVLNRGAHWEATPAVARAYAAAVAHVRRAAPRALVLVRSTPPGHAGCWAHARPLAAPPPPAAAARLPYNWGRLPAQNAAVRAHLQRGGALPAPGVLLLDVAPSTALRPDRHVAAAGGKRDCLHYLPGGAPETWARFVAGALGLARRGAAA